MLYAILLALALTLASPAHAARPCCDLDDNGVETTVLDWGAFLRSFGAKQGEADYNVLADFNQDGKVTAADHASMMRFCPLTDE